MHTHSIEAWTHQHVFLGDRHRHHERRTQAVVALTAAMMVAEIVGGTVFGSMALVADGWHMSTHAAALGIATLAYRFARLHADDPRFTFGTGKLGDLAAFTSAIVLGLIALLIGYQSVLRLFAPVAINAAQAIPIAVLGLAVNVASVWLLHDPYHHDHDHDHRHDDTNLRAAYVHVLADALTSVLAILALLGARFLGWTVLDPLIGLLGAAVIAAWAVKLVRAAGAVLVDAAPSRKVSDDIRERLETGGDRVTDLHLWQIGPGHRAAVVSIVSDHPQSPAAYKSRIAGLHDLSHVTVEVEPCQGDDHRRAA